MSYNSKILYIIVCLRVPFGLIWEDDVVVNIGRTYFRLRTKRVYNKDNGLFTCNAGDIQLIKERDGKLNYTEVKCLMENMEGINTRAEYLEQAMRAINIFLTNYRVCNKEEFFVDKLREKDLLKYDVYFLYEDKRISCEKTVFLGVTVSPSTTKVPELQTFMMRHGLSYPLWCVALANAKNRLDLEDYPQSIIEANIALENFVYTHIYDRLTSNSKEIENILGCDSPCVQCSLQIDEKEPLINVQKYFPSIYSVVKRMFRIAPVANYSLTKIEKIVKTINQHRNAIVHGRNQGFVTREMAEKAIIAMEKLIEISLVDTKWSIKLTDGDAINEEEKKASILNLYKVDLSSIGEKN